MLAQSERLGDLTPRCFRIPFNCRSNCCMVCHQGLFFRKPFRFRGNGLHIRRDDPSAWLSFKHVHFSRVQVSRYPFPNRAKEFLESPNWQIAIRIGTVASRSSSGCSAALAWSSIHIAPSTLGSL